MAFLLVAAGVGVVSAGVGVVRYVKLCVVTQHN